MLRFFARSVSCLVPPAPRMGSEERVFVPRKEKIRGCADDLNVCGFRCASVRRRAARDGDGRMRVRPSLSAASYRQDTLLDGLLPPSAESGGAGAHDPRRSLRPPTSDGHRGARLPDRRRQEPKPLHEEDRSSAFGRWMRYALYRPRPTRGRYSGDYLPVRVRQGAVRLTAGNHASPEAPRRPCLSRWTLFLRRPVPLRWGIPPSIGQPLPSGELLFPRRTTFPPTGGAAAGPADALARARLHGRFYFVRLRNSWQTMPAAIATLSDSEPRRPGG